MNKIDPAFAEKLKKYGSKDFETCYDCGSCTAVCSLTDEQANFPRMLIRYGTLGLKSEILSSKELWLCYACGECSETCPRQANPGDYMSALRRYAIAHYEPTGITKRLFTSSPFAMVFSFALAVALGFFLLTLRPETEVSRWIFQFMPYDAIHDIGLVVFTVTGLMILIGISRMIYFLRSGADDHHEDKKDKKQYSTKSLAQVLKEVVGMSRHRKCDNEEDHHWQRKPWALRPWFVHWSIMWGFLGLLAATTLDFIFKDPATDIWWPSRILGTLTGLLMMYGATLAILYRIRKVTATYAYTHLSDWLFLITLWLAGFTGFWLEIAVTVHATGMVNHLVFIVHTIISMELVLLFVFSKFAHALYRPIGLFFYFRDRNVAIA